MMFAIGRLAVRAAHVVHLFETVAVGVYALMIQFALARRYTRRHRWREFRREKFAAYKAIDLAVE